ncbi:Tad domain-containing protein [Nocardioides montaniterrae]
MRRPADERGSSLPLVIVLVAIVMLLIGVVVDASAAYLGHQQVDSLADGAALRGADLAAQGTSSYGKGLDHGPLNLSQHEADAAVRAYLRDVGAARDHPGLRATVAIRGNRVVVVLTARVRLPLHVPGAPILTTVRSVGSAEVLPDGGGR